MPVTAIGAYDAQSWTMENFHGLQLVYLCWKKTPDVLRPVYLSAAA
jgi:hypothetical protein